MYTPTISNSADMANKSSHQPEKTDYAYLVEFNEPPSAKYQTQTKFCFTSLAAIYDQFTPEQVGCRVEALWSMHISDGNKFKGPSCTVSRLPIFRKKRK